MGVGQRPAKTMHPARDLQGMKRRIEIRWEVHAEPTKRAGEEGRRGPNQDPGYARGQGQA